MAMQMGEEWSFDCNWVSERRLKIQCARYMVRLDAFHYHYHDGSLIFARRMLIRFWIGLKTASWNELGKGINSRNNDISSKRCLVFWFANRSVYKTFGSAMQKLREEGNPNPPQ